MFTENDCATLPYWFAHWCAFQLTALNHGVWKWKYLLHDIEKPFLMFFWRDHKRVQKWHVLHSKHHEQGKALEDIDWIARIIDMECGRLSKSFATRNAREYYEYRKSLGKLSEKECEYFEVTLNQLGL